MRRLVRCQAPHDGQSIDPQRTGITSAAQSDPRGVTNVSAHRTFAGIETQCAALSGMVLLPSAMSGHVHLIL